MSLVTGCAKRQVMTSLTLLVFGVKSVFRYSFQDLSFGKDSYRDGVIGKNNTPRPPHHHLQYFIIVLEADADVS
jgi:hypothetical protein